MLQLVKRQKSNIIIFCVKQKNYIYNNPIKALILSIYIYILII